MAEVKDVYGSIYENLINTGCDISTADQCIALAKEKKYAEILSILSRHRATLLGLVRVGQKQIDCLDFLIYKIKKQDDEKEK